MGKVPVDVATGGEAGALGVRRGGSPAQHADIGAAALGLAAPATPRPWPAEVFPIYLADVPDLSADGATVLVALDGRAIVGTARRHVRPTSVDLRQRGTSAVLLCGPTGEGGGRAGEHRGVVRDGCCRP